MISEIDCDVAIIGGGPSGSTAGCLLKKYAPQLKVAIFERELFPREHVGESQLPPLAHILDEMGCWDKVEAANFPIKIGATYRWGQSDELWDFEFLPSEKFKNEPRPNKFEGQRRGTAFQVDRAIYDKILLDHAKELGCDVYEETKVLKIHRTDDRVDFLELEDGREVNARYFIDASGHSGILRRAMDVKVDQSKSLQNIAVWDYWQNADWAVEIGVGGTRVQVLSQDFGWVWFIPLGPTRTSVGLIVPAEYYKTSGKRPEDLYEKALANDPVLRTLMKNATSEGCLQTTKDWSFISKRMVGENWFLVGESAGFADPLLAAGLTISQAAAREAAFTILELDRGTYKAKWLKEEFELRQTAQISNHIRFANYWYTANAQFNDLQDFTAELAAENGLDLSPEKAWAWIAQGGFINLESGIGTGGFDLSSVKDLRVFVADMKIDSPLETNNIFVLNLQGATRREGAYYHAGSIVELPRYVRDGRVLPITGPFQLIINILQQDHRLPGIIRRLNAVYEAKAGDEVYDGKVLSWVTQAMEAMISDGWIKASYDPSLPLAPVSEGSSLFSWNTDEHQLNAHEVPVEPRR